MSSFEHLVQEYYDGRLSTLAAIRTRSLGADALTLTALKVLVYSQLEGGVKDLTGCLIKHINRRRLTVGQVNPVILRWRNIQDLEQLRRFINFDMISSDTPFAIFLNNRANIRPLNRIHELNQMNWRSLTEVYAGLDLNLSDISIYQSAIDQILEDRNTVAHHGQSPTISAALIEKHLRNNAAVVESVLTDMSVQMLSFFENKKHMRASAFQQNL